MSTIEYPLDIKLFTAMCVMATKHSSRNIVLLLYGTVWLLHCGTLLTIAHTIARRFTSDLQCPCVRDAIDRPHVSIGHDVSRIILEPSCL